MSVISNTLSQRSRLIGYASAAVLAILGLLYIANGLTTLVHAPNGGDLGMRWKERNYLMKGIDPYDVSVQFHQNVPNPAEQERITQQGLAQEAATLPSGYPPWGLSYSFILVPPGSLDFVKPAFGAISILALLVTTFLAYRMARPWGAVSAIVIAAAVFAMFGNASTLRLGQYGLILNMLLIGGYWLSERGKSWVAGVPFALVAVKPSFSLYQFTVLLMRWRWKEIAVTAVICLAGSILPWVLTGVNPIEITLQMLRQSSAVIDGDTSFVGIIRLLLPQGPSVGLLALGGLVVSAAAAFVYRKSSFLVAVSVAAVAGRLCMYHRQYDNVMLMFPLLALGLLAASTKKMWLWAVFAIYGLTLWAPIPYSAYKPVTIVALSAVWIVGCAIICIHAKAVPSLKGEPAQPQTQPNAAVSGSLRA